MRIRACVVRGAKSVITAILVVRVDAKGVEMEMRTSIRMGGEGFGGKIMRGILTSVSGPRGFFRMLLPERRVKISE